MGRKRNKTAALLAHFDQAASPIYCLDIEQTLIYCNRAACDWLEQPTEAVLGRRCAYLAVDESAGESSPLPLAPPPSAWLGEVPCTVWLTLGEAAPRRLCVTFLPLRVAGTAAAMLAVATAAGESSEESPPGEITPSHLHDRLLRFRAASARRYQISELVGDSPAMVRVREQARMAGDSRAHVLIVGEAGSGRQRVAKTIHYAGGKSAGSIAPISCPVTDAEMLQSAIKAFVRRSEELGETEPGSMLLIDVDQLAADAQHELGGFLSLPGFDIRMIGTARTPLTELAAADAFDPTLAYRLCTLTIELPALRERRGDIALLAQHFLEQANAAEGGPRRGGFTSAALELIMNYQWPGNLPQLREAVAAACQTSSATAVGPDDLPPYLQRAAEAGKRQTKEWQPIELDRFLEGIELELVQEALAYSKGNKTKAAELLGISRARLIRRVQQLGLEPEIDFEEI